MPPRQGDSPEQNHFSWEWKASDITVTDENLEEMERKVEEGLEDCKKDLSEGRVQADRVMELDKLRHKIEFQKNGSKASFNNSIYDASVTQSNLEAKEGLVKLLEYARRSSRRSESDTLFADLRRHILVAKINAYKKENGIKELTNANVEEA